MSRGLRLGSNPEKDIQNYMAEFKRKLDHAFKNIDMSQILLGLTAGRIVASNTSKVLSSVASLTSWIAGTTNQITITDDGDGTITISVPQDIHSGASPTFAGVLLSGLTASRAMVTDGSKNLASSTTTSAEVGYLSGVTSAIQSQINGKEPTVTKGDITGTSNRVSVTGGTGACIGSGVTLSTPQDIHSGASPVFAGMNLSGDKINIATTKTPASASATGTKGDICYDSGYIYVCTATDTWKRTSIATW